MAGVGELPEERDATLPALLGLDFQLEEGRGRLVVSGLPIDLACGVDGRNQRWVCLERLAIVGDRLVRAGVVVLVEVADAVFGVGQSSVVTTVLLERTPATEEVERGCGILTFDECQHAVERALGVRVARQRLFVERAGASRVAQMAGHDLSGLDEALGRGLDVGGSACPSLEQIGERGEVAELPVVIAEGAKGRVIVGVSTKARDQLVRPGVHTGVGRYHTSGAWDHWRAG